MAHARNAGDLAIHRHLTQEALAKPIEELIRGNAAAAAAAFAAVLAALYGGPLAGAAAGSLVYRICERATNTATKRLLTAEKAWDSEQARDRALARMLCAEAIPQLSALHDLLTTTLEREHDRILELFTRSDAHFEQLLPLLRQQGGKLDELLALARLAVARQSVATPSIAWEGPGHVPALRVPQFHAGEELDQLTALLSDPSSPVCVVVHGMGGVGKTLLATQWVATRAKALFPDGALWLEAGSLTTELARAARCWGWDRPRDPSCEEAKAKLGTVLHERRALLVIDDLDEQTSGLDALPFPGGTSRTLITSRDVTLVRRLQARHIDARPLELGPWSAARSREYMRQVAVEFVHEADRDLDALTQFVGRLPLALGLLAAQPLHDRQLSASLLLRSLVSEPIGTLDRFVNRNSRLERGVVKTFLAALGGLSPPVLAVMRALSVCARATRTEVVAGVLGLETQSVDAALNALTTNSLARFVSGAEAPWGLHDLVRLFVREHAGANSIAALETAHQRWIEEHLVHRGEATAYREVELLLGEVLTCVERLLRSGDLGEAHLLYLPIFKYLLRRGGLPSAMDLALPFIDATEEELSAAWEGPLGDELGSSDGPDASFRSLALCYWALGDVAKAAELHQLAIELAEEIGNLASQASNASQLGCCLETLGDTSRALECLHRSLRLYEQTGDVLGQATAWGHVSKCHEGVGEIHQALEALQRSLQLHERMGSLLSSEAESLALHREHLEFRQRIAQPLLWSRSSVEQADTRPVSRVEGLVRTEQRPAGILVRAWRMLVGSGRSRTARES